MVRKLVLAVLLGGMAAFACCPAQAGEEPPKLIRVDGPIRIMDPHRWLFAVPDGEPTVVLSAERNRELLIGRLDISNPRERVAWEVALTGSDVGTTGIDGHWHLFAHDAHWIVVSTPVGSFLLKLDRNLKRLGLFPVVAAADPDAIPTGDMFMVAEPNGVAIGHFLPDVGHRVFRIDTEGQIYKTVAFGGFPFLHSNGASAELTVDGFLVLAPMTLDPRGESPVSVFWTDADWQILSGAVALVRVEGAYRDGHRRFVAVRLPDRHRAGARRDGRTQRAPLVRSERPAVVSPWRAVGSG